MIINVRLESYFIKVLEELAYDLKRDSNKLFFTEQDVVTLLVEDLLEYRDNHELNEVYRYVEDIVSTNPPPLRKFLGTSEVAYVVPKRLRYKLEFLIQDLNSEYETDYTILSVVQGMLFQCLKDCRQHPRKARKQLLTLMHVS